jgi:WD40 repeat protein
MKHRERVNTVVFSLDEKWILTGSADNTVRIWNSWTGEPLTPPFVHLAPVRGARFVTSEHGILTWDRNQDERIWAIHVTDMPASDVIDLSDVLTGGSINPDLQMPSANLKALQSKWQDLKGKYPALFSISPDEVSAWHEAQVLESEVLNQWVSASFHLKQLLSVRPKDEGLLNRLSAVEDHLRSRE